jgi:molybdate transport system regulatory protein
MRARKVTHKQAAVSDFKLGGRIWVEKDGELYLGWGRVILLQRIAELGSIAAAARSMKLGYRNAWLWVEAMNRLAPVPLVEKATGGERGGHASLTDEGRQAIDQYQKLRKRFQLFIKKEF